MNTMAAVVLILTYVSDTVVYNQYMSPIYVQTPEACFKIKKNLYKNRGKCVDTKTGEVLIEYEIPKNIGPDTEVKRVP
jgi:hypothetical protein